MRRIVTIAAFATCAITGVANNAIAQENLYELKQVKATKIVTTKSSKHIDFTAVKNYDKYIISISGDGGYNHQFESDIPTLSIDELNLPYDGSYNYEVKAIKHVAEVKDTMNNGRSADARGKISVIDVTAGQFATEYNEIVVVKDKKEVIANKFPKTNKLNKRGDH